MLDTEEHMTQGCSTVDQTLDGVPAFCTLTQLTPSGFPARCATCGRSTARKRGCSWRPTACPWTSSPTAWSRCWALQAQVRAPHAELLPPPKCRAMGPRHLCTVKDACCAATDALSSLFTLNTVNSRQRWLILSRQDDALEAHSRLGGAFRREGLLRRSAPLPSWHRSKKPLRTLD